MSGRTHLGTYRKQWHRVRKECWNPSPYAWSKFSCTSFSVSAIVAIKWLLGTKMIRGYATYLSPPWWRALLPKVDLDLSCSLRSHRIHTPKTDSDCAPYSRGWWCHWFRWRPAATNVPCTAARSTIYLRASDGSTRSSQKWLSLRRFSRQSALLVMLEKNRKRGWVIW